MAASNTVTVLLLTLVLLYSQALEPQFPRGRRSKRDFMASMVSFFSSVDKRLAAVETRLDNSTEERLAQLEAKMEGEVQEKLQHMEERQQDVKEKLQDVEEKLQSVQGVTQRLESMVLELLSSRLEAMVTEILTSKLKASEEKVAELVEAKTNATEERLASLEASSTEAQASPAACKYQFLYQYEKEAPRSSADLQRVTKLETELTRLQEKVSALDKSQQDSDHSTESLHNASVLAMEGVMRSVTGLVAASQQNLQSIMQNATETLAFMLNDSESRQLARAENNAAVFNTSILRVEQSTKDLATRMSSVEDKVDNATSLHADDMGNIRKMLEDLKNATKGPPARPRKTCRDYYEDGQRISGLYTLELGDGQGPMHVFCDMVERPGYVVFQRREDGSVDFFRNWTSYENGFGDLTGEFWLGNRDIHRLNNAGLTQLRVDLQAWDGSTAYASYSHFSVGDASSSYRLSVSGYSGTAGDSLAYHNNQKFSTHDQDNDGESGHCAQTYKGAWWYESCHLSNLNGLYGARGSSGYQYIVWHHWLGTQSLQRTELKLK